MVESVFGIDPGSDGAVAWIVTYPPCCNDIVETLKFKTATRQEILQFIVDRSNGKDVAYIEKVSASPQMGVVSAFTFGRNYERVQMACVAAGVPIAEEILPREWQRIVGVRFPKGSTHTQHKQITRQRAQEMFPGIKITNAVADALLIAAAGCRKEKQCSSTS